MKNQFYIALTALSVSCAATTPQAPTAISSMGTVPELNRTEMPSQDGGELRSAALDYYAKGDYVRALRFGYWAAQTIPTDVRLRMLLGIVYDGGFDRPDLAIPEYQRALSLKPDKRFDDRLRRRIHYLNRRLIQNTSRTLLTTNSSNPLSENWLALYPLEIHGPKSPDPGLEIGLIDWILPEVQKRSPNLHVDAFTAWIVSQVYREVSMVPSAPDFARWSGAGLVLTGSLSDLGNDRLRLTLELLGPSGEAVHVTPPVVVNTTEPAEAHAIILEQAVNTLQLLDSRHEPEAPIRNPVALPLYAQGLAQYLTGQVEDAYANSEDATALNPGSSLLESRRNWAESDMLGGIEGGDLLDDYHRLLSLPDPNRIVRDRLTSGHSLGTPSPNGYSGSEIEDPYKPPRPDRATP